MRWENDNELQDWAKMLAASVEDGGAGIKVDISIKHFYNRIYTKHVFFKKKIYMFYCKFYLKAHLHQIKIATDRLPTGFWLASDCKIGVNGTMLYQCNPTAFYQLEASLKLVWS